MDRSHTTIKRLGDDTNDDFVPGTMAERIALVWPLTKEVAVLSGYDVDQRLRKDVTRLIRRQT